MDIAIVGLVAFLASGATLYSGFGLGTVLLPAFALFFPVEVAVAATGAVHLLNNLFKGALLRKRVDWRTVARFGLPAIPAAIIGAWLLGRLGHTPPLYEWRAFGQVFGPSAAGVTIGVLMILFAVLELQPRFQRLSAPPRLMPLGGALTGFFGGLTGQQGAFRSMFLLKSGLEPTRFIATGVFIAVLIDVSRLPVYAAAFGQAPFGAGSREALLIAVGTVFALAGAYLGVRYLEKVTIAAVRGLVVTLMVTIGILLIAGVLGD